MTPDERLTPTTLVARETSHAGPVLWPLYAGAFLSTYLFAVANVAAPGIQRALGADEAELSLTIGGFGAAFAAALILCGRLGDRYGRRRLFAWGTALLAVTSVGAGLAPTIAVLVLLRIVQGLAAAIMMPQILAGIQHAVTGQARMRALGLFTACAGVGTTAGQIIGGGLVSWGGASWGWRIALFSCAAVALAALTGSRRLEESRSSRPPAVDVIGAGLTAIVLIALTAGLSMGPVSGWLPLSASLLAIAAAVTGLLLLHQRGRERRGRDPLLPPSVMKLPAVRLGMLMAFLFFAGYGAFTYDFALLTQGSHGAPAVVSGATLVLFAAAFLAASLTVRHVVARWGGPMAMMAGAGLQAAGLIGVAVVSFFAGDGWALWFQLPAVVLGAGQALQFGPLVGVVVAAVPAYAAGLSGGLISTMQQAGIALGVALLGGLWHGLRPLGGADAAFAWVCLVQVGFSLVFALCAYGLKRGGVRQDAAERVIRPLRSADNMP